MKVSRVCLVLIVLVTGACFGQSDRGIAHSEAGSSVFGFLRMGVDGRSLGMARVGIGMPNDVYGALSNPAALAYIEGMQAFASYRPIILDVRAGGAGFARPFSKGVWALSATYISFGEIDGVDHENKPTGETWGHQSLTGTFSWARGIMPNMGVGASIKGVYDRLASEREAQSADGFAADVGWQYRLYSSRLILGLLVRNIGFIRESYTDDDPDWTLPWSLGAGISYVPRPLPGIRLALDLEKPRDDYLNYRAGAEFRIYKQYLVGRAGFQFSHRDIRQLADVLGGVSGDFYHKTNWSLLDLGFGVLAPTDLYEVCIDAGLNIRVDGLAPSPAVTLLVKF